MICDICGRPVTQPRDHRGRPWKRCRPWCFEAGELLREARVAARRAERAVQEARKAQGAV